MAAPCFLAAAPKAAGSSLSATSARSGCANDNTADEDPDRAVRLRFPKTSRLRKRGEFQRVYQSGARAYSPYFTVTYMRRPEALQARVGFTVPRRLGGSVVRNRIRRRLREAVRQALPRIQAGWDFVFHPRAGAVDVPMEILRKEVEKVFLKCEQA